MAENVNETLIANAIGGGGGASDDIRKRLILAMLQEGTSGAPVAHFTQGLDRIAKAMLGGLELRDLDRSDREFRLGERDYWRERFGVGPGSPGAGPGGGRPVDSGPRSASLPPQEPPPAQPDTPFRPVAPLTNLTPQPDMDTARVAAAAGTTPLVPPGPLQSQPGGVGPLGDAARSQLAQGLGAGQRGAFGANSILPPTPSPDPTMALTPPAESAGAMPPPLAPPGPPAVGQRPLTPPAPSAAQGAQAPPQRTPAQIMKDIDRLQDRRTSSAVRADILQNLIAKEEIKEITDPATGEKAPFLWNARAKTLTRVTIPPEARDPSSPIPPAPPGVDPKLWREQHSKSVLEGVLPATAENMTKLRKEVQDLPSYKNVAQSAPVYRSMRDAAGRDTRGSDVNLIYGMAKLMDPGSVVRESEMTVAQAIATLPQGLAANIKSQLSATGRLDADVRRQIMEEAHSRMQAYNHMYDQDATMFRDIAQTSRMNVRHVVPSFGTFEPWKPAERQTGGNQPPAPQQGRTPQEGDTATGPRGQRMILRNGRWEPLS